ncbi:MAG TPA: hypothetical protein VH643_26210 [Gemmataceae bacterium]|jgi:hypothetical protein
MGEQIEPALRRVLDGKPSLEVRNRVQAIQASLHGVPPARSEEGAGSPRRPRSIGPMTLRTHRTVPAALRIR